MICLSPFSKIFSPQNFFISCWREILICTMCVCACVAACVTQFSVRLLQLDIFCRRRVLMNFHALEYFFCFYSFWAKIEWVIAIFATLSKCLITLKLLQLEVCFNHIFKYFTPGYKMVNIRKLHCIAQVSNSYFFICS